MYSPQQPPDSQKFEMASEGLRRPRRYGCQLQEAPESLDKLRKTPTGPRDPQRLSASQPAVCSSEGSGGNAGNAGVFREAQESPEKIITAGRSSMVFKDAEDAPPLARPPLRLLW